MSPREEHERFKKNKSSKSSKSKPTKSTEWSEWSEWMLDESHLRWYKYRQDANGQYEFSYPDAPSGLSQIKGGHILRDTEYGECPCDGDCAPSSGCSNDTRFGDQEPEARSPEQSQDMTTVVAATQQTTTSLYQPAQEYQYSGIAVPSANSSYQSSYEGDTLGQQQGYAVATIANYTTSSYTPSPPELTQWINPVENAVYSGQSPCNIFGGLSPSSQEHAVVQNQNQITLAGDGDGDGYSHATSSLVIRDTPADSDHGTVFGQICEDMGLLKESYWKDPEEYQTPSYWNPQRLKNNCVFVSVGYLLGMSSNDLSQQFMVDTLPKRVKGVKLGEMERILQRISGLNIVVFPFRNQKGENPRVQQAFAMKILEKWIRKHKCSQFAIGYRRVNGSGHCVVAKKLKRLGGYTLRDFCFTCFQRETGGSDVSKDVMGSFIMFAIFLDPDSQSHELQMDFFYTHSPQSTASPFYGAANHVQLGNNSSYSIAGQFSSLHIS